MSAVRQFVENDYFSHAESSLSPATTDGYRKMWRSYGRYLDEVEFSAPVHQCQKVLRDLCLANPHLKKSTVIHLKNFFSGIFTLALRLGYSGSNSNPFRLVKVPTAPDSEDTWAYAPEEIEVMLRTLDMPYELIVLFFASTGLRKSEARGVQWGDVDLATGTLSVERAVWRTTVKTTKNKASKAPIPLVPNLAKRLAEFKSLKAKDGSFVFANSKGGPMDFDLAARRFIIPSLKKAGVVWHGFHAFRRGLATTLHAQGIPDKEIQRILRHSNVNTTQACYVRVLPENVRKAMDSVVFGNQSNAYKA